MPIDDGPAEAGVAMQMQEQIFNLHDLRRMAT
jgi:hypothetical protein